MLKVLKLITLMSAGALFYGGFELVGRGYTHISMGILGGISLCIIHFLDTEMNNSLICLTMNAAVSAFFITSCELLTGEVLNRGMCMRIWDYSNLPLNFDGQICVLFSILWFMLSIVGILLDMLIRRKIFQETAEVDIIDESLSEPYPL